MANTQENKKASEKTLREHFAGLAMQGILTNIVTMEWIHDNDTTVGEQALKVADYLLEELDK